MDYKLFAREAGFYVDHSGVIFAEDAHDVIDITYTIHRFAEAVRKETLEQAAQILEEQVKEKNQGVMEAYCFACCARCLRDLMNRGG